MKKVIFWEPKRDEKRRATGDQIPGEYVGKFRTKVDQGTKGAIRYQGENAAGIKWDYWGLNVDSVSGQLRWIDKQDNGDYGTNLVLFLETEQFLHRVSIKYDPYNLRNIMNNLCGLKSHLATQVINLSYWVRKKQDSKKNVVTDKDGKPIWAKSISFRDISPEFDYDQWTDFSADKGLDWFQETRPNGKKEWNCNAEYRYWDSRLVSMQRYLLKTEFVLPFCYNSMTACEAANPSGGGNLTAQEIELTKEIYERVKGNYRFPFTRSDVSADDAFNQPEIEYAEQVARVEALSTPTPQRDEFSEPINVAFPTQEPPVGFIENEPENGGFPDDDNDPPF